MGDNEEFEDIQDVIKKAYKSTDSGKLEPKTWICCQDCTIMGYYAWCPGKRNITTLNAEEGCPLGRNVQN